MLHVHSYIRLQNEKKTLVFIHDHHAFKVDILATKALA